MPRKHLVASQTNKKQQANAKLWQKAAREIRAAAKVGGTNLDGNPRLKVAVDKALRVGLSRDSIDRNIAGASKDPENLTSLTYECYGPNGTQFIVSALTDNSNRTASNLRGYLSKIHGEIARANSVKIFFDNYAQFILVKNASTDQDAVETVCIEKDIDLRDFRPYGDEGFEVLVNPSQFFEAKKAFEEAGFNIHEAEVKLIAQNKVDITDEKLMEKLEHFIDSCNDDDDIQSVVDNLL